MAENDKGKKTTLGPPDCRIGALWIYTLRKDELLIFAQEFGFDGTGKVDEMRRRFAEIVKAGELGDNRSRREDRGAYGKRTGGRREENRREGEWSVADQEHINRFLQQELEEFEGMSGVSHIAQF